jgi:dinuclear metal center YbgI/SA1388 family protein
MKTQDLTKYLNNFLEIQKFKDYCPNGLQVSGVESVKKIAFAVSATLESIQKSIKFKADALIVHHGILWNYDGAQIIDGPFKKRIKLLLDNNINLLAYHLPLDAHLEVGNAAGIALQLGLKHIAPFGDYKGAAVGVIGELPQKLLINNLKLKLSKILNHTCLDADADNQQIKKIAIVTGSGANYYKEAYQLGAQCLVTGEMSEYHWHGAKELGISILAGGHHATERFGVIQLSEILRQKYKFNCQFFDSENPI